MKITTKLPSDSPVTCVTHKRFAVLTDDAGPTAGPSQGSLLPVPDNEVPEQVLFFRYRFHLSRGALDSRDGGRRCRKENSF